MPTTEWPPDWDARKRGKGCVLCATLGKGDNDHVVTVAEMAHSEVWLERRSRLPGYCVVVWRHGHVCEPTELRPEQATGYWHDVLAVSRAIEAEFHPVKMNMMMLGNTVPHLHTHVVPRYLEDPAPAGPIPWPAMLNEHPTDIGSLRRQADALRAILSA